MKPSLNRLLDQLEASKRGVGKIDPARLAKLLNAVGRQQFRDAESLGRFHELLVFLRAFPPSPAVLRKVEQLLASFARRVSQLKSGVDLSSLEEENLSGIVGTSVCAAFHYDQVAWLAKRFPRDVEMDLADHERTDQLAATLPRFLPLLEEDSLVEADVPYPRWVQQASRGRDLAWLLAAFERLPLSPEEKAEIFGGMELPVRWKLGSSKASRTLNKRPVRKVYFHIQPLIRRNEVSLAEELARSPLKVQKLSRREGEKILDLCREATTVRYRELYGTTRGDPTQVLRAAVGRGVEIFLWGLPPERRLPLRAYQAGFTLKNGVPINYIEGISLFEWMEIGFNTFYAYREGETAWIYAQALRFLRQVLGVSCISVYPYQIGKDNEEAIASGAYWFYRKLGFRPMRRELGRLSALEEKKIASRPGHRTPPATLRRLARGHVVYEVPDVGAWDGFSMRTLGFAIQRRMAERFAGNASKMRQDSRERLARILGISLAKWSPIKQKAFDNFVLVLSLIPDVARWTRQEKNQVLDVIRAKAASNEPRYSQLLRQHSRLRSWILRLGSS